MGTSDIACTGHPGTGKIFLAIAACARVSQEISQAVTSPLPQPPFFLTGEVADSIVAVTFSRWREVLMRRILLLVAIMAVGFVVLIQGRAKAADDETQLIQLERSWNQAEMGRDAGAIASLFDDTLVYVDYDGSLMNKAQYLRTVADPTAKPEHMHDEGMKVHVYSSAGVVTGVY